MNERRSSASPSTYSSSSGVSRYIDAALAPRIAPTEVRASSSQDNAVEISFSCRMDRTHTLTQLLSTLNVKKDPQQLVNLKLSVKGIKFTVEESRIFQTNLHIKPEYFSEFLINEENSFEFKVSLPTLVESLNLFNSNPSRPTSAHIVYMGRGSKLIMVLTDKDVTADISLQTYESEGTANFNFRGFPIYNKIIMQSPALREAFNELDWSSPYVSIMLSPDAPHFRLQTGGDLGSCQVDHPKESKTFELFDCSQTQSNGYKLELLQPCVKALALATKSQLRVNTNGVLNLQHMISLDEKHMCFIDFFVIPSDDGDEDGDGDAESQPKRDDENITTSITADNNMA